MVLFIKVDVFSHIANGINHFFSLIEMNALLAVITKFHRFANLKVARIGLYPIEQQFDKSGFTYSIITHDAQFLIS